MTDNCEVVDVDDVSFEREKDFEHRIGVLLARVHQTGPQYEQRRRHDKGTQSLLDLQVAEHGGSPDVLSKLTFFRGKPRPDCHCVYIQPADVGSCCSQR